MERGALQVARTIFNTQGMRGIYRGFTIITMRDAPAHGDYFWTYEYTRESLHPSCRKSDQETLQTMLVAGGLAGVASWSLSYPSNVMKALIQAQKESNSECNGIVDCFLKSVKADGLWSCGTDKVVLLLVSSYQQQWSLPPACSAQLKNIIKCSCFEQGL